jgi:uncharacterized protein
VVAPRESEVFEIRDRRFVLDTNSLACYQLEDQETVEHVDLLDRAPQFPRSHLPGVVVLVLEATHACNLRCRYCFVQTFYENQASTMSVDTGLEAINHFFSDYKNRIPPSLGFFGGEPLLNWGLIEAATPYMSAFFSQKRLMPRFSCTTNATLVDEQKADFFRKHRFSFIVSLDGPQELHDLIRVKANGKGSFEDTMRGLSILSDRGVRGITLRGTFTKNAVQLTERLSFLNRLCEQGIAQGVSVEPVSLTESTCMRNGEEIGFTEQSALECREEYLRAADWFVDTIRKGGRPRWHQVQKTLERLAWTQHAPSECGASQGYVAVAPDGEIFSCHREMNTGIGNLHTGGIDEAKRAEWADNRLYCRPKCMQCPIRWVCGGGCREESKTNCASIHEPWPVACAFKRLFVESALWILSELDESELRRVVSPPRRRKGKR